MNCSNTCEELGRSVREEEERLRKVIEEGHRHFQEYSAQGQRTRLDKEVLYTPSTPLRVVRLYLSFSSTAYAALRKVHASYAFGYCACR